MTRFTVDIPAYLTFGIDAPSTEAAKMIATDLASELEGEKSVIAGPYGSVDVAVSLDADPADREPYLYPQEAVDD